MQAVKPRTELQLRKEKLASSYNALLEEFSSSDLRSVGNYTLGKLIGKGSFGKVYLATHKLTNGSKVVLKSAKKDDANLAREIHHHRQFIHPHIARLYEVIVTENLVWLVLEYCPGDELYNYLFRHGRLPPEKVQKIFSQLVGAVAFVHSMSCVHRDLKLENILLDKNENVKLCDFGFTREYEPKFSHLQTFCGTVCYSAPEMLKGEKYAGEKVDVWSLGVILYALLMGELPFDEDDDLATKHKILTTDPKLSDSLPADARALLCKLLSKRPLIRPSLADILNDPFLAPHAAVQQTILKVNRPPPFSTALEREVLQRMRSAGVNIDKVIENVLSQRCDALAGWWALLIEKEERKEKRRAKKREEKELETKSLRRISGTSSRRTTVLEGVDEDAADSSRNRGRRERRSFPTPQLIVPELPRLPEGAAVDSPGSTTPPPPIEKDPIRSGSTSRTRPPLPPKERERRRSRNSAIHLVAANPDLLGAPPDRMTKRRNNKRHPNVIINQLASLKHWFVESAKRAKSPGMRSEDTTTKTPQTRSPAELRRSPTSQQSRNASDATAGTASQPPAPAQTPRALYTVNRSSLSPGPLTPHSSTYRRSSHGLRGRKSTSSSLSSIRSMHHVHTHSKASSTSSTSNSVVSSALTPKPPHPRSPHNSVKVLPATPTISSFPSNIRVVRRGGNAPSPINVSVSPGPFDDRVSGRPPPSPGLIFARRKKSPFRAPNLHLDSTIGSGSSRSRDASVGGRSASLTRRRSGQIIEEEEEEEEDEIEEVDAFSPLNPGDIEETIIEEGGGVESKQLLTK